MGQNEKKVGCNVEQFTKFSPCIMGSVGGVCFVFACNQKTTAKFSCSGGSNS